MNDTYSNNNNKHISTMPKENDGRRFRRKTWGRILLALVGIGALVIIVCFGLLRSGSNPSAIRIDRSRLRPLQAALEHQSRFHVKRSSPALPETDDVDLAILRGEYTLIDVRTGMMSLHATPDKTTADSNSYYSGVMASFCRIDWSLQANSPAKVPMFRDLQGSSMGCQVIQRDLGNMVRKMRQYDVEHSDEVVAIPPTAVVFHETRCGSTLIANLLAAAKPNNQHMVYSESPPPVAALKACDGVQCDPAKHIQLIQDVFYVMGRRRRPIQQQDKNERLAVFYKIQSIGSHNIGAFTKAFPNTPWWFVFRDSVEVMMSHVDPENHVVRRSAVCMRSRYYNPKRILAELIEQKGKQASSLSNEQYCAAHLATLCLSALKAYESQSPAMGHFVNYQQLPDILWESILPHLLNITLTSEDVERMKRVAGVYSKGRFDEKSWEQDAQQKRNESPLAVREAAKEFMDEVYERLQQLKD